MAVLDSPRIAELPSSLYLLCNDKPTQQTNKIVFLEEKETTKKFMSLKFIHIYKRETW